MCEAMGERCGSGGSLDVVSREIRTEKPLGYIGWWFFPPATVRPSGTEAGVD